ncbi:uncharacterized protein LOC143028960 [Oratosquilla oratoria]|uniref:uncharacterized protein LOC143028960 n=1 Tax=Oratosquilla oratoria TaxID=337810 RepID=UPI003F7734C6
MYKEAKLLRRLSHVPGLPRAFFVCPFPLTLITSYDGPTTLYAELKKEEVILNRKQFLDVLLQVAISLQGLQECGVAHNDLKPDNVVLRVEGDKYTATTIDLGHATVFGKTPYPKVDWKLYQHVAPELTKGHQSSPKSDVFSMGQLMASTIGRVPALRQPDLLDLIRAARKKKPEERITIQTLVETLRKIFELEDYDDSGLQRSSLGENQTEEKASTSNHPLPQKRKMSNLSLRSLDLQP